MFAQSGKRLLQIGQALDERVRTLELIYLTAQVFGAAAMYTTAYLGFGYWSLALNLIVIRTTITLLAWWCTGWVPGWTAFGLGG